ncbi:MAG: GTPase/DUF3482 domain-containing protein [Verrucomicrobiales bacterium]|nr:GTPase/DUF3482 domain-containing protein [Verrucomicrobiales bacterium]
MSDRPLFAVVGHPNKGKSSIVATLAADDSVRIGPEAGTTTQARRYPMRVDGQELYALVDTPGFQRARRVLHWLRQHERGAHRRAEVVRQFVASHRDTGEFPDECELLEPILEGAGILYVVDGSVPYGPEYEPEMEILRWTGQPSLALVNPIGPADHLGEWQAALGQFFQVVRVFNAVTAEFRKRIELLRAFGELQEEWRGVLEQAVRLLEADRARTRRLASHTVAETLAAMLAHRVERKLPARANPAGHRAALEAEFRSDLRRLEQRCRDRVETLYSHRRIERQEAGLPLVDEDLFAERTWLVFGLGRRQILAGGALGGAATGAWVDAHLGGASLFAGAVLGAGIGAVVGWWTADQLVRVRVMDVPLGGRLITAGPTRNRNFPHVVFNRARYHHWLVARRTHAAQGVLAVREDPRQVLPPLPGEELSALEKTFGRLRRHPEATAVQEELADHLTAVFARDDEAGGGEGGEHRGNAGPSTD